MIYPIVAYGNAILRTRAKEIEKGEIDVKQLASDMFETMAHTGGIGLAAPQINKSVRFFVLDADAVSEHFPEAKDIKMAIVNPVILEEWGDEWTYNEGCLSFPGLHEDVTRKSRVRVRYQDLDFNTHEEEFDGIVARIIQHEYDHLEGKVFTDRLSSIRKVFIRGRLEDIAKGKVKSNYRAIFAKGTRGKLSILLILLLSLGIATAQKTHFYDEPDATFRSAVELYSKAKYGSAQKQFEWVLKNLKPSNGYDYMREEAMYYSAMCNIKLFHSNADAPFIRFLQEYPQSSRISNIYFSLGNFEYNLKQYKNAIDCYEKVDVNALTPAEKNEFAFRKAYSLLMQKKYLDAEVLFYSLIEEDTRFRIISIYYYAYCLYVQEKYQSARVEYEKIEDDPSFEAIIPYFILQIDYKQKKYDEVINKGLELLPQAKGERKTEISHFIGDSYFKRGKYAEALPFLKTYIQLSSENPSPSDYYNLGFACFSIKKYDSASYYLQKVATLSDTSNHRLIQSALYHLGYIYANSGKVRFAMESFKDAAAMGDNAVLQEDASYNYAKLIHQKGQATYQERIDALRSFLEKYPTSVYRNIVHSYLVDVLMTTRNYKEALGTLAEIPYKTAEMKEAEQRLFFGRGVELFNMEDYENALSAFVSCEQNSYNDVYTSKAIYWSGVCLEQLGKRDEAVKCYNKFLSLQASKGTEEYAYALFNMGIIQMEQKQYAAAVLEFNRFLPLTQNPIYKRDASINIADCEFMQKKYSTAFEDYEKAMSFNSDRNDYILYQQALCSGALAKYAQKISLLKKIDRSPLMPLVLNELGATYMLLENNLKAEDAYNELLSSYPNSPLVKNAYMKMGMMNFNEGRNKKALEYFKNVIEKYNGTQEAKQSLLTVKNIYIAINRPDEFFDYAKKLSGVKIDEQEQDSVLYLAAENMYLDGNCNEAISSFVKYLTQFPKGFFVVEALNYLADCANKTDNRVLAKETYEKLAAMIGTPYTEQALLMSANMNFSDTNYSKALEYYKTLRSVTTIPATLVAAQSGVVRSYLQMNRKKEAVDEAQALLKMDNVSDNQKDEANIVVARLSRQMGDNELSDEAYMRLTSSKNPNYQAEARYILIEAMVRDGLLVEAEQKILDYISDAPSNDEYLAKMFILWADIYQQRENLLQAKQTLQSIIENYDGEDLKKIAQDKYDEILQKEAAIEDRERWERESRSEQSAPEIEFPSM
ncbi:MAG: peptide deformylase [Bacteroidales bacterium]|jgi:peptide deformylase|nr:peptide deformylase [Bacteroidales bacterium]